MYDNLLEKMIYIITKYKNEINEDSDNANTKLDNIFEKYVKELEYKILTLKNAYLYTLIRKHYCIDDHIKRKIIIQGNIPRKRNAVKICFNELISFIQNKYKKNERAQKYYYILFILNKYKIISDEDILMAKKLYKENKIDKLKYTEENISGNNKDIVWIPQIKSKKSKIFKIFTVALPLAYILTYFYSNLTA